jgi:CelD/BcsL family acetyltransferase involved in cellulose biosynthesis
LICASIRSGFAALAPQWRQLLAQRSWTTLFITPEWQQAWWEHSGDADTELYLLTVGPESAPLGIAPLALRDDTLTFLGDTDLFDYHDFIDVAQGFFEELAECLESEAWRVIDLHSVPEWSPAIEGIPAAFRKRGYTVRFEDEDVVPGLELPGTWDDYLGLLRKKDRHELRRKLRRLESAGEVRVVEATAETLEADVVLFLDLMMESREEKREFMLPDREAFFQRTCAWTLEMGILRLMFLELDGERVATALSFDHDGKRLLYNSGYRLAQSANSVGLMLNALCIKDAIERGLHYFDFLRGPEPYKYHLGGKDRTLHRIVVTR